MYPDVLVQAKLRASWPFPIKNWRPSLWSSLILDPPTWTWVSYWFQVVIYRQTYYFAERGLLQSYLGEPHPFSEGPISRRWWIREDSRKGPLHEDYVPRPSRHLQSSQRSPCAGAIRCIEAVSHNALLLTNLVKLSHINIRYVLGTTRTSRYVYLGRDQKHTPWATCFAIQVRPPRVHDNIIGVTYWDGAVRLKDWGWMVEGFLHVRVYIRHKIGNRSLLCIIYARIPWDWWICNTLLVSASVGIMQVI